MRKEGLVEFAETGIPGRAGTALSNAVSLHLERKQKEALREVTSAIQAGETEPALHAAAGYLHYELEEFQEAAKDYSRVLELEPSHEGAPYNLGVCLARLNRWEDALSAFRRA